VLELGKNSGRRSADPELRTLYRLAEALGVPPEELLPSATAVPTGVPSEARVDYPWSEVG